MNFLKLGRELLYYLFGVLLIFVMSRFICDQVGVIFHGETYLRYWQFIDVKLLQTDLWRNIFYLHSQPPLMNVFVGLVLHFFPSVPTEVFHGLFFLAGLFLTGSLFFLGVMLGFSHRLSAVVAVLFSISPSAILYEHWMFYTYFIATALTMAGVALYLFIHTQKAIMGGLFFGLLASISLTWSLFHIVWLMFMFVFLLFVVQNKRKILLVSLVPLLLVFGWYAKNLIIFGEFTSSTWAGMNLSNATTFRLPEKDRLHMIKKGELSKLARYIPFSNPGVYIKLLPETRSTGIPILDLVETSNNRFNHHHLVYVEASKYYLRDDFHVIRVRPALYIRSIGQSLYIFFHSSSDYNFILANRDQFAGFDLWWNRIVYGQWKNTETYEERMVSASPLNVGWWIVFAFGITVPGGLHYLWRSRQLIRGAEYVLISFLCFTVLFVAIVGNLMDIGENNRFRFVTDPFILLLFVFVIRKVFPRIKWLR